MRSWYRAGVLRVLALLLSCIALPPLYAAEPSLVGKSEWLVRTWQTADGLPQNSANAVLQDRAGFLWIGTNGGLARFDGVRFRVFGLRDGLKSVRVSALAEDSAGALWVGTTGGGVSQYRDGSFITLGPEQGLPAGTDAVSLAATSDGTLWIGTPQGLFAYRDNQLRQIDEAMGLPSTQIRALGEDGDRRLWVGTIDAGVYRQENGRFVRTEEPGPDYLYSLAKGHHGDVWGGAGNGELWHWSAGRWQRFDRANGLPLAKFLDVSEGPDGTLWIATEEHGLYERRGERFAPVTLPGDLAPDVVQAVTTDREGCVWIGTRAGGLKRLSPRLLRYWGADPETKAVPAASVVEDAAGTWWVAAGAKGLFRMKDGVFTSATTAEMARAHHFYSIVETADGAIWAAGEQCLYRVDSTGEMKTFLDLPVRGEAIRALCADGNEVWAGTYYSTLLKCDGQQVRVVAPRGSFSGDITAIVRDDTGALWIGSAGGVFQWKDGRIVQTIDARAGLLTPSVLALHRDPAGVLWMGTRGGGVARSHNGHLSTLTTREGLIDDVITQVVTDDAGALWLGSNRGIMRVPIAEAQAFAEGKVGEVQPTVFALNEGLLKEQCIGGHSPNAIRLRDGRLLFPTAGGLAEVDPQAVRNLGSTQPQPIIDRVMLDGRPQGFDQPVRIPPGAHRLEIAYTAPSLRAGEWVRFRHRLEGFEADWTPGSGIRAANYEGLPAGSYNFRVGAVGNDGQWQPVESTLAIVVLPHFWRTWWFRLLLACLVIGINATIVWWNTRRRHLRRIAELERERQHQAELAHAGRVALLGELSASLAHELKQPLAAILSNAQAGLRFLQDEEVDLAELRDILKDIATSDRRASEIIEHMRAMMKSGEVEKESLSIEHDVVHVLGLLRSDLVARGVEVETDLAEDLPPLQGDHIQLQQVLLNLVVNGCDAMQEIPKQHRRLRIQTARENATSIRLSVIDSGPGVAPGKADEIFKPFFSTKAAGLGMGLAICRAIIKAHGGRLWAENHADGGAVFSFTLPIPAGPEAPPAQNAEVGEVELDAGPT